MTYFSIFSARSRDWGSSFLLIPSFRARPAEISPMVPRGQIHPQNTRPKSSVMPTTAAKSTRALGATRRSQVPELR